MRIQKNEKLNLGFTKVSPCYNENPIVVWNMKELNDEEKRIAYTMVCLLLFDADGWNDSNVIAHISGIDEPDVRLWLEQMIKKGYIKLTFLKPYFTSKFFSEFVRLTNEFNSNNDPCK